MNTMPPVVTALLRALVDADARPELEHNVDPLRFPDGTPAPSTDDAPARLAELLVHSDGFQNLYKQLPQPGDRELLVRLLAFRVLGHRRVQLPMTLTRLQELAGWAGRLRTREGTAPVGIFGWSADDYDLTAAGYPIALRAYIGSVVQTFGVEQYRCPGEPTVALRSGDVVIDGGAHWGDTALYCAHLAGPGGRVFSYEFEPTNLEVFEHNRGLNPELASRIELVPRALWDQAGQQVSVQPFGPGTHIAAEGELRVATDSIDALAERAALRRVDFIKLDIEGAELAALRGAETTLRRFRPRLAIAAYHHPADLAVISEYLAELGLGYRFRLGHTTMHSEESVLFAIADAAGGAADT